VFEAIVADTLLVKSDPGISFGEDAEFAVMHKIVL